LSREGTWSLGGQIVAGASSYSAREEPSGGPAPSSALGQQLFLGNVPMFKQTLTIVYLQELIRRGIDPRAR
jgi:hypothetical protein